MADTRTTLLPPITGANAAPDDLLYMVDISETTGKNKKIVLSEVPEAIGLKASTGSTLVGDDDGATGTLWTTVRGFITYLRSSLGSSIVGFIQSGTGAVARTAQDKMRESVSVFDFMTSAQIADVQAGALLVDVTAAIQAALDSGVKRIFAPAGSYSLTTLTIPANVTIVGEGKEVTLFKTATTGDAVTLGGHRIRLENLSIYQTSATNQGKGIVGADKYWFETERVEVRGFQYNLYQSKAIYHSHKQSMFEAGDYGAYYWGAAGVWNTDWFNNVITFDTCRFNGNAVRGCYVKGTEVVFINPDFSGMNTAGAIGCEIVGESTGYTAHGIKIVSPYVEATLIPFSFSYASAEIDGGFVQGGSALSRYTSIIDASNSTVYWNGRPADYDYWDYGYRLTNSSKLFFEYGFATSDRTTSTVDATSDHLSGLSSGTFTATLTGCTTAPTVTAKYTKHGNCVTVSIPANNATSNATSCDITGLPAHLYPPRDQPHFASLFNDGAEVNGLAHVLSSGVIQLSNGVLGTTFTASGLKGHRELSITYQIV